MGLGAVSALAEKITDRLEDEVDQLRKRLDIAEVRHDDLKRSVDARTTTGAEVVELPNRCPTCAESG